MSGAIVARLRLARPGADGFALQVDLTLPGRGVSALFGPSGSGKTTLLRCIAGLERAQGYLEVGGAVWQDGQDGRGGRIFLPTHRRPLAYVFQEASLFAHLSVRENLDYGVRRSGAADRRAAWGATLDMLGIAGLLARMPAGLSGGERQRVAIARALLTAPRLLLMDEPLAALDHGRKQEILPYLERLREQLAIPMLYVSHQADEVARLADHLVLLAGGRAQASGPLTAMLARLDLPSAFGDDAGAVVEAVAGVCDPDYGLLPLDFAGGRILVPAPEPARGIVPGRALRLRVRARDVSLALGPPGHTSILNRVPAVVAEMADAPHPAQVLVRLDANGASLLALITRRSRDQLGLAPGMALWAQIKSVALLA